MSTDRKAPGRPRTIDGPGSRVMSWLPKSTHDTIIKQASDKSTTVSALIRESLVQQFVTTK